MRRFLLSAPGLAALALAGLLISSAARGVEPPPAGNVASALASTSSSARIVEGLAIQKTQDLDLGEVRAGASAGTVRIDVGSGGGTGRTASGGVALSGSAFSAAQFQVTTGAGNSRVQISLPAAVTLSRVGGSETLVVRDFRARLESACGSGGACGDSVLLVGASLQIAAEQPSGSYAGTFTVTVNQF